MNRTTANLRRILLMLFALLVLGLCSPCVAQDKLEAQPVLRTATFQCDVTPPLGSPLCYGFVKPVERIGPVRMLHMPGELFVEYQLAAQKMCPDLFVCMAAYGEHGLSVERRLAYEETLRLPLLVRYPPMIESGSIVDEIALSIDLTPTLIELANGKPAHRMDGRSLTPLLRGEHPKNWRTSFLVEYNTDTVFPRVLEMGYTAVRTTRWKYIRYNTLDGMDELYDLKNDPYEMKNLIACPVSQSVLNELRSELGRLLE